MSSVHYDRCVNPFKKGNHGRGKHLRYISSNIKIKFPGITDKRLKICNSCRKQIYSLPNTLESLENFSITNGVESNNLNDDNLVESPKKTKFQSSKKHFEAGSEVLQQIIEKFQESTSAEEKILLLTLAPKSWGYRKLSKEFHTTYHQAKKAKKIVAERGILSPPNSRAGHPLSSETESLVKQFYESDEHSRVMPGLKDCISVKQADGSRISVQKRLLLANLSELFEVFKAENANIKIGLAKFCQLRPPYCVSAGSSGTHVVCVCTHHENVKLMIEGSKIKKLTENSENRLTNYQDYINLIICNDPMPACHLNECKKCPGKKRIEEVLKSIFEEKKVDKIEYQIWQNTDRTTIKTEVENVNGFIKNFGEKLLKLKVHDFILKNQLSFLKEKKENLEEGHFLIQFDYAENYAFVAQNAAQAFYWNNNQASLFTVVIYYKENGKLMHKSMVIISDNLNHDTMSVYQCQELIISYLKENFSLKKIIYFSDGAPQHFKNKNSFLNLRLHLDDFGIPAEWHFQVTGHGKGPCDGIGGNLKCQARRASLQNKSDQQILSAFALFKWAERHLPETEIRFIPKNVYDTNKNDLEERFINVSTIPGTQQYHSFIPISNNEMILKKFSSSNEHTIYSAQKCRPQKRSAQKPLTRKCSKRRKT